MGKFNRIKQRILSNKTELKLWQKIVTVLSCFAVFVTTYALILPAITINSGDADLIPGFTSPLDEELNSEINEKINNDLDDEFDYEIEEQTEYDSLIDELNEENSVLEDSSSEENDTPIYEQEISESIYIYIYMIISIASQKSRCLRVAVLESHL